MRPFFLLNQPFFYLRSRFWLAGLFAALAAFSNVSASLAEQAITSDDQPIDIRLTTTLNAETARYGDPFEGVLTDTYQFSGKSLPEGTVFKGRVQRAHKSLPLGMPGYVVLQIDEAQFPSGAVHAFQQAGSAPRSSRIVNPNAPTRKKLFKDNLPYNVISTATSVPLRYAAGFSSWTILPIALGSRIALGVAMQMKGHPTQATAGTPSALPITQTVGQGIMQGSGLKPAYYFLTVAPEPVLTQGTVIPLHFRSRDLADLFAAAEVKSASQANTLPQPTGYVPEALPPAVRQAGLMPLGALNADSAEAPVVQASQNTTTVNFVAQPAK